jgi:uncharacterized delta-60 repeat protein
MKKSIIVLGVLAGLMGLVKGVGAQVQQEWVARFNGWNNNIDIAKDLVVDNNSNVYVTGRCGIGVVYLTIKYNSAGQELWSAYYGSDAEPAGLGIDGNGNVYVTGRNGVVNAYGTIKYSSVGVLQWESIYYGWGQGYNGATSLAIDASGNVYVTGSSTEAFNNFKEMTTIKYNTTGVTQWVKTEFSPYGDDEGTDIVVNSSGYVYVTGWRTGNNGKNYWTIKYSSSNGSRIWENEYNGPSNGDDVATGIAVDGSGNVYVTGWSAGSGTGNDYATIKYNSAGVQQWAARYNGPGNSNDGANSIAVSGNGNIYVTGESAGSGTGTDYATIKYNSAGVQQWVTRYNGPGNSNDQATRIAANDSGYVYVTGGSAGSGTSNDYATIKYNSAGVQQWVIRYNGPGNGPDNASSLVLRDNGNVYITGGSVGSGTGEDYATIKYNQSQPPLSVTITPLSAIVYADSSMQFTSILSWQGGPPIPGLTWTWSVDPPTLGTITNTGLFTAGPDTGQGFIHATTTYQDSTYVGQAEVSVVFPPPPPPQQQWVARYNGPGNGSDKATSLALDGNGNSYVTGFVFTGSGTSYDYATIKYNPAGDSLWTATYNGPVNAIDSARCIAVDGNTNVYVSGSSTGNGTGYDYATIKYSTAGVQQWVARYNGLGNSDDHAYGLAVDQNGNVYVTGNSQGSGTNYDYATVKYNSAGVQQWATRYNGPNNASDWAWSLAVDLNGNVYVTGQSLVSGANYDYATVKYNSDGVQQWVSRYNGPGNYFDAAYSLAVDQNGNVYVTGESVISGFNYDYTTIKYNSAGVQQWVSRYDYGSVDQAYSLAIDQNANVYVAGKSQNDYATIKYNTAGQQQWAVRYNGPANGTDQANSLVLDSDGNVFVTGYSAGSGTGDDYATIKYNPSGQEQLVLRYDGLVHGTDRAASLALDGYGNVYVTGGSTGGGTGFDYATVKYSPSAPNLAVTLTPLNPPIIIPANGGSFQFNASVQRTQAPQAAFYVWARDRYPDSTYTPNLLGPVNINPPVGVNVTRQRTQVVPGSWPAGEHWYIGYANPTVSYLTIDADSFSWTKSTTSDGGSLVTSCENWGESFAPYEVVPEVPQVPARFGLDQNHPNPFNPATTIGYQLKTASYATLKVYDIAGRLVVTLVDGWRQAGSHSITFDGSRLASGVYLVRLEAGGFTATQKMVLLK